MLAANGSKDVQVPAENLQRIGDALSEGGNGDFELVELPGLNHLFQTAETGDMSEYEQIEETFAPHALNVLGDWIVAHTLRPTAVVETRVQGSPAALALSQNHPNPFNGHTLIPFSLSQAGPVSLTVFDALGQRVAELINGPRAAGTSTIQWDGRSQDGHA